MCRSHPPARKTSTCLLILAAELRRHAKIRSKPSEGWPALRLPTKAACAGISYGPSRSRIVSAVA